MPRIHYDEQFKSNALAMMEQSGLSETAKQLNVSKMTLSRWYKVAHPADEAKTSTHASSRKAIKEARKLLAESDGASDLSAQVQKLAAENARLLAENAKLKNALKALLDT